MLHLFDAATAEASPSVFASLAAMRRRDPDIRHRVLLIGGQRLIDAARRGGLHDADHLSLPGGHPWLGPTRLKPAMWRDDDQRPDVIHAWSAGATLASLALARGTPRVITLGAPLPTAVARLLCGMTQPLPLGPTVLAVSDPSVSRGLESLNPVAMPLAIERPPFPEDAGSSRMELRQKRWGISPGEADGHNQVVALLSDPAEAADAVAGVIATGLASETLTTRPADQRYRFRLLVHPRQHRRPRAHALMNRFGRPDTIIQEPRLETPWRVLPGCDLAVAAHHPGQATAAAWAMAAGVPVIAYRPGHRADPPSGPPADIAADFPIARLVNQRTAWLTPANLPKAVAEALAKLATDPQRGRDLADHAAAAVRDHLAPDAAVTTMHRLYRRVMSRRTTRKIGANGREANSV